MDPHPEKARLDFLDGLRGLAAAYVMIGHARWLLWEGYTHGFLLHPEAYPLHAKAVVYALTAFRYGSQAVLFFFVLSGFVIHLRYSRRLSRVPSQEDFAAIPYLLRRARRVYPPLLLAMVWTYGLDRWAGALGYRGYFTAPNFLGSRELIAPSHSWITGIGNLLFMNGTYVVSWGCNGVVWSLKYEGWFYILYPLFFLLLRRSLAGAALTVAALFALTVFPVWPIALFRDIFSLMIVWWFGVMLADVHTGRLKVPYRFLSMLCLLLPFLILNRIPEFFKAVSWGLFFTGLISVFFLLQEKGRRLGILNALKPLGDMSYSLYLLHFPLLMLISGWLMDRSPSRSLPRQFGWMLAGIALSLIAAYAAHFLVERPFLSRKHPSYS